MSGATPESRRRFRWATAFLIHWLYNEGTAEGEYAILREVEDDDGYDGMAMAAFVCALAEMAWRMAKAPDRDAAEAYVRRVMATAALDEVTP